MKVEDKMKLAPFFANSVPKSGTHLLHQILNGVPNLNNDITKVEHKFFMDPYKGKDEFKNHQKRLKAMKPNQFAIGHLHYSKKYAKMLRNLNFRQLFLYRDPRDVLVSLAYFIPMHWKDHPLHFDFKHTHLKTKKRIELLVLGVPGKFPSFMDYMGPFYEWIHEHDCFKIKFEQLVSSPVERKQTVIEMLQFLWETAVPPTSFEEMAELAIANIDPKRSRTFRRGTTGQWRAEFDENLTSLVQTHLGKLIKETGYI